MVGKRLFLLIFLVGNDQQHISLADPYEYIPSSIHLNACDEGFVSSRAARCSRLLAGFDCPKISGGSKHSLWDAVWTFSL